MKSTDQTAQTGGAIPAVSEERLKTLVSARGTEKLHSQLSEDLDKTLSDKRSRRSTSGTLFSGYAPQADKVSTLRGLQPEASLAAHRSAATEFGELSAELKILIPALKQDLKVLLPRLEHWHEHDQSQREFTVSLAREIFEQLETETSLLVAGPRIQLKRLLAFESGKPPESFNINEVIAALKYWLSSSWVEKFEATPTINSPASQRARGGDVREENQIDAAE